MPAFPVDMLSTSLNFKRSLVALEDLQDMSFLRRFDDAKGLWRQHGVSEVQDCRCGVSAHVKPVVV